MHPTGTIYHVCRRLEWIAGAQRGAYPGSSQDAADGFIHFSTGRQVRASAAKHRAGQTGLVLLTVAADALGEALRWEVASNGDRYPHLYGPLAVTAVLAVDDLPLDEAGHHVFPDLRDET